MRESTVEKQVCEYAKQLGWRSIKLAGMHDRGKPDRMFLRNGKVMFVEFKAPGHKPTALQMKWLNDLSDMGFTADWVDSVSDGKLFFDSHDH